MAGLKSGDRPGNLSDGAIEGQQDSVARASDALEDDQALADRDQTLADVDQTGSESDQTLSDADQTSADSDQTSADCDQLAADSDQAASDRDLAGLDPAAHGFSHDVRERTSRQRDQTARQRDKTAQARLDAAERRDAIAHTRDLVARARDHAAEARSLAVAQRDAACQQDDDGGALSGSDVVIRGSDHRKRVAQQRTQAAEQRAQAAQDRQAAAEDRDQAAHERLRALVDREALARRVGVVEADPSTGARTRAAGLIDLDHELDRCRETGGALVVACVDFVAPATFDDSEGRAGGDKSLRRVVALIKEHLRSFDLIVRLDALEFLCAMSNMTLSDARQRFGVIAAALAGAPDGGAIRTAFVQLTPGESADDLIARADSELIDIRRADRDSPQLADTSAEQGSITNQPSLASP